LMDSAVTSSSCGDDDMAAASYSLAGSALLFHLGNVL